MSIQPSLLALAILAAGLAGSFACATARVEAREAPVGVNSSGGPLLPEQAAYDVLYYALRLRVDPEERSIDGSLTMRARLVDSTPGLLLHLDDRLKVHSVRSGGRDVAFERASGRIRVVDRDLLARVGDELELEIAYGGVPRVAPNAPWDGGFSWKETADGSPWIATTCQGEGADLWWPCKDHPSDEPDSMDLFITVPSTLEVASNGRLKSVEAADEGWHTYHWHVSTPINNYGVALNIAPYRKISTDYESVTGETFPVTYWVLPENYEKGEALFEEIVAHMRFFEETFGPYPFRADKYGVAETPHLGMEHQSIIAYGNRYKGNPWGKQWGFDFLHHHELAHEWWANLVTALDWKDMWLHEGFATYAQALYVEELHGIDAYHEEMRSARRRLANRGPVAPHRSMTTDEIYFGATGDSPGGDIYYKGSCVLHTLRWVLGDEDFFPILRRMAYLDPASEATTDGSACRFSTTDEFQRVAEELSGQDLEWFFQVYLRQPELPRLESTIEGDRLSLRWKVPGERPFPMPVPVLVEDELVRVEMEGGQGSVLLTGNGEFEIDPPQWVLAGR